MSHSLSDPYPSEIADPPTVAQDRRAERLAWWLAAAGAVTSIILGVMVLAWPDATLLVGAVLFGVWLLVQGLVRVAGAVMASAEEPVVRAFAGVIGVLLLLAAIACLRNVLVSLASLTTLIGAVWLIVGIVELFTAFDAGHRGFRSWPAAVGLIGILAGLTVLTWPRASLAAIVYLTGGWLVVTGLLQALLVLRNRPIRS